MTSRWMGLAAAGAVVMTTLAPRVAQACSPPSGSSCRETIDLFAEVEARPTNACILATWVVDPPSWPDAAMDPDAAIATSDAGSREFLYVANDGTEIPLRERSDGLWCPERALDPLTEYAVVGPTSCGMGAPREYGRFTTGTAPDTTPPTPPGAVTAVCFTDRCGEGACCGPYVATIVSSVWEPATDDGGVVLYAVRGLQREAGTTSFFETSGRVMFDQVFVGGRIVYRGGLVGGIVAFDIAGNASEPGPSSPECTFAPEPDAGPEAGASDAAAILDAGVPSVSMDASILDASGSIDAAPFIDASPSPGGGGSCAASRRGGAGASLLFTLALSAAARRARARARTGAARSPEVSCSARCPR